MYTSRKISLSLHEISYRCWKQRQLDSETPIVLTSGCFDLLHGGHLEYLVEAKSRGFLVVGINSDESVRSLKGVNRPIRGQDDRVFVVSGFECVDCVVAFNSDIELIQSVNPDIYIASQTSHNRVFEDRDRLGILRAIDCTIVELPATKDNSTTDIIQRITNRYG